jgi:hypothetical protein
LLTEMILTQAVKSAVGYGFSEIVKAVFAQSEGLSDREILEQLITALKRHGAQIGDLDTRLARLEALVETALVPLSTAVRGPSLALPPRATASVFCERCGTVPGNSVECPGYKYTGHSWQQMRDVFCERCGTVPGHSAECPAYKYTGHSWRPMTDAYCERCGTVPGHSVECPAYKHSGHYWRPRKDVYCERCGAVPGRSVECPGYKHSGHYWKST